MTKFGYFVLVVLLVALGGAGLWWYRTARKTSPPVSLSQEKSSVLERAKITFPSITSLTPIAPPDLPKELATFIQPGATEPEAFVLMYGTNRTGYRIEFRHVAELAVLQKSYRIALDDNDWTILNDSGTSPFAFIEAENSRYRIRVEMTRYTTASVVGIQAIVK